MAAPGAPDSGSTRSAIGVAVRRGAEGGGEDRRQGAWIGQRSEQRLEPLDLDIQAHGPGPKIHRPAGVVGHGSRGGGGGGGGLVSRNVFVPRSAGFDAHGRGRRDRSAHEFQSDQVLHEPQHERFPMHLRQTADCLPERSMAAAAPPPWRRIGPP